MGMLWDSVCKPFRSFSRTSLVALFYMIPVVNFITHLFNTGYLLEVAKHHKDEKLPEWQSFGRLFFYGIMAHIICLSYILIPFAAFLLLFRETLWSIRSGHSLWIILTTNQIQAWISLVVLIIFLYLVPAALVAYSQDKKFGDAFRIGKILKTAFKGRYFLYVVAAAIYASLIFVIALYFMALSAVTLIMPFVIFGYVVAIIYLAVFSVFGNICEEQIAVEEKPKKKKH